MNGLTKICKEIAMPQEVTDELLRLSPSLAYSEPCAAKLLCEETYREAAAELKELLQADDRGMKMLAVMLSTALKTRMRYTEKGIPEDVYLRTMQCFSRFVKEHRDSYGFYGFDRSYWTGRQLSMLLFRLGELEYEISEFRNQRAIAVHIPSDADLAPEKVTRSIKNARAFFAQFYPLYESAVYFCDSWLLSPVLKNLLPASSKIILFQNLFEIVSTDETSESYKQWVFKNKDLQAKDFPENTSLQRNMKRYVLQGGKIGEAVGTLIPQ